MSDETPLPKPERPSYMTSTFSIMSIVVVVGLTLLCIWQKDVQTLQEVCILLLGAYGVRKGMESTKNGGS